MIVNVLGIGWTTFLSLLAAKNRLLEASGQRKQRGQKPPIPMVMGASIPAQEAEHARARALRAHCLCVCA